MLRMDDLTAKVALARKIRLIALIIIIVVCLLVVVALGGVWVLVWTRKAVNPELG